MSEEKLISIIEAAEKNAERLKKPEWEMIEDHIKIDIVDNKPGPWVHLFSPFNKECNGKDPVSILLLLYKTELNKKEWLIYKGPLPGSSEYENAEASFKGVLNNDIENNSTINTSVKSENKYVRN